MTPENDRQLRLLRGYLLDTLSPSERKEVDRQLAQSADWRESLERQRRVLEALDALPRETPPPGLAAATVAAAHENARADALKRAMRRRQWGTVLVTFCVVAILGAFILPSLTKAREAARRASDQNNLKQLGIVLKMYANESPGEKYPPIAPYRDVWMFDLRSVYPEYLTDLAVLVDPSLPDAENLVKQLYELASKQPTDWETMTRIAAKSYTYTAWGIQDVSELTALADARRAADTSQLDDDIEVDGKRFYRLREGIERFFITDINNPAQSAELQSIVPVIFNTQPRVPRGGNALYLDGHVAFDKDLPDIPTLLK